ncbi:MAG: TM2 domain-containing protein [Bdellovibrionales bacterium]|nr:TM2 domain-containing protein [Bdellovibrionales bacterium]
MNTKAMKVEVRGAPEPDRSEKSFVATLLLCLFLGLFGVHRFYAGRVGTGILMLLTLGLFGLWAMLDLVMIAMGRFTDGKGNFIKSA